MGKITDKLKGASTTAILMIGILAGIICGAGAATVSAAGNKAGNTAAGTVIFSYDGISDGLLPDGSPFYTGKMEEELNAILAESCPGASVTVTGAGSGGREVPTTSFQVIIHTTKTSGESPEIILENALLAYQEQFRQTYYANDSIYEEDPEAAALLSSSEYRKTADILKAESGRWVRYLEGKEAGLSAGMKDKLSRLEDKISAFRDVKIAVFASDAQKLGLSVNEKENALSLSWELNRKNKTYDLNLLCHQTAKDGIAMYDAAMSNTVLVPTLDSHSAFYMSRTKIGVDYLTETAEDYLGWAEDAKQDIIKLGQALSDLKSGDPAGLEAQKKELLDDMDTIREEIRSLDEEIWETTVPVVIEVGA